MEQIASQLHKDRLLFREIFLNASNTFKDLMNRYKKEYSCSGCRTCCEIRYSKLSPDEIKELDDPIAEDYRELFLPYETPPKHEYVDLILSKHEEPVYFYYCKNLENCTESSICKNFPDSITTILPKECDYRNWQKNMLYRISKEIEPDIANKVQELLDYRAQFECNRTGTCCRLACSEFTYEELKQKAANNDNFATQFTSIFVPYENIEEARKVYPEFVDLVGEANFYYCKHLIGANTCPIYEDRPQICRDFPDNPLSILPHSCGYHKWKEEVQVAAYTYYAMSQIYGFYFEKIKGVL